MNGKGVSLSQPETTSETLFQFISTSQRVLLPIAFVSLIEDNCGDSLLAANHPKTAGIKDNLKPSTPVFIDSSLDHQDHELFHLERSWPHERLRQP